MLTLGVTPKTQTCSLEFTPYQTAKEKPWFFFPALSVKIKVVLSGHFWTSAITAALLPMSIGHLPLSSIDGRWPQKISWRKINRIWSYDYSEWSKDDIRPFSTSSIIFDWWKTTQEDVPRKWPHTKMNRNWSYGCPSWFKGGRRLFSTSSSVRRHQN